MTTAEQKIIAIQSKINKLKQDEKKQKAIVQKKQRNARTKRLIEIGAEVESVLGSEISKDDLPKLRQFLIDQERRGNYFSRAMQSTSDGRTEQCAQVQESNNEPPF